MENTLAIVGLLLLSVVVAMKPPRRRRKTRSTPLYSSNLRKKNSV
jgi:hypothetical protein